MSPRERTINLLTFQAANFASLFEMLGWGENWPMMSVFIISICFMVALEVYVAMHVMEERWANEPKCPTCRMPVYE